MLLRDNTSCWGEAEGGEKSTVKCTNSADDDLMGKRTARHPGPWKEYHRKASILSLGWGPIDSSVLSADHRKALQASNAVSPSCEFLVASCVVVQCRLEQVAEMW